MKILAIRGKNLASLKGEFEIDFRKEPLLSSGLFAITGNTGSGKTTILDTMCIALYATSPRLEKIKDCSTIEGSGSNKVTENNPKTILRRGCNEGYAEVDFLAIDGNEYRTRWSVSRSNGKADGNFRKTEYDLFNLTTGEHTSLKAKEFKSTIPSLIGLTYEQFTRSVLLAQGEFAAFLNATENEKAKILQTLTGTGIYSRISAAIYKRYTESNRKLELIEAKKQGLEILTEEQKEALLKERDTLNSELQRYDTLLSQLNAKKEWIERAEQYSMLYAAAKEAVAMIEQQKKEMEPVIAMLRRIDSIQDIRDKFNLMRSIAQQRDSRTATLAKLKEELKAMETKYSVVQNDVKTANEKQQEINREWDSIKPLIREAAKIEESIAAHIAGANEITKGKERIKDDIKGLEQTDARLKSRINTLGEEQEKITDWFRNNSGYESIISVIPSIIANLQAIENAKLHIEEKSKSYSKAKELLSEYEKRKSEVDIRKEELEKTLASEIAELRKQLVDGEPCPVCGSRHHETTVVTGNTLAEKELAKAKAEVKATLEYLAASIEGYRSEADKLQSAIETYNHSIENFEKNNYGMLGSNADAILTDKNVVQTLTLLAADWKSNNERLASIKEEMSVIANSLHTTQKRMSELAEEVAGKEGRLKYIAKEISGLKEKIAELLGSGNTSELLEKRYGERIAETNRLFSDCVNRRSAVADEYNRLKGETSEKERFNLQQEGLFASLHEDVDKYLKQRDDCMTLASLEELIDIDSNYVASMRKRVEQVNKAATSAIATMLERKRNMEEHEKCDVRPKEGENAVEINGNIENTAALRNEAMEKASQINATLIKDNENSNIFGKYKEEHKELCKITENWRILNNTFGSAEGDKLMKLTQEYTLDILLDVANRHLQQFSGRYRLSRISAGSLGIKVIDLEMMQDNRSVHTLSGGETFIASLALSLALSSISSNRMSIGSLFIDEGFGALDSETLRAAIDTLEKLKEDGRKIGVISHLSDMLDRIPTRIKVIKGYNGKSRIEI